ncbi:MAG: glycosyltransferase family 4 protein [Candidatus Paceibacterota bacterium]
MKICLYSPYFPKHTGGGEKYLLDTAQALTAYGQVFLAVPDEKLSSSQIQEIYTKYQDFLGHDLKQLNLISSPLGTKAGFWQKFNWTRQFDLMYFITDGSLFLSGAGKSVIHIQTPLLRKPLTLFERLKKISWQFVNTNSAFTRQVVEKNWHLRVNAVHHPMVDVAKLELLAEKNKKEKIILHVGRFFRQLHSKRQDVLVKFFGDLRKQYPQESKGWQLVLIGSVEDEQYASEVKKLAKNLPIKIIHTVSREQLNDWYAKAAIYWHATGYGVSEAKHPEKMEHFGISTVEAMASRAVPVVIDRGGQPEILGPDLAELLWQDEKTCLAKTAELMNNDLRRSALADQAQLRSQHFGPDKFEDNLRKMMKALGLIP